MASVRQKSGRDLQCEIRTEVLEKMQYTNEKLDIPRVQRITVIVVPGLYAGYWGLVKWCGGRYCLGQTSI